MRIGIDATSVCRTITGMEGYALGLIKSLLELDRPGRAFLVAYRGRFPVELEPYRDRAEFVRGPASQIICEQLWLPALRRSRALDLVHYPAFPPGALAGGPFIATIFDGSLWRNPAWMSWKARLYLAPLTRLAASRARKVLTISEFSRLEIIKYTGAAPEDVLNAGIGVHPAFRPVDEPGRLREVRRRYSLPPKYVLAVGSLEPRKNLGALLRAFVRIRRDGDARFKLVLAGRPAWGAGPLAAMVRRLGLEAEVISTGYVRFADLPAVYSMAELFVYPSLYEGFGLPPVEAMACGTPVVCSNAGALPEAVGSAAETVDPTDIEGLAEAMRRMLDDEPLRRRFIEAGRRRSASLGWGRVAGAVDALYNSLDTTPSS